MRIQWILLVASVLQGCASPGRQGPDPEGPGSRSPAPRPARNVVLIMTDDQGHGDFGFAGNPLVRTPNLDTMAAHSARLPVFYVSPVCTPTRAALMTGRHPQRTRAIDTWLGRAMMDPEEVTVAEVLRDQGFATGIFGKWHLGDCHPMRAGDQGFAESLVHRGGGIGQPADPLGAEGKYTDPILFHNGTPVQKRGYCTDIYFDAAIGWMRERHRRGERFFVYLPTNAPHAPFHDVPGEPLARYESMDLGSARYPQLGGHPLPARADRNLPRILAMIENIDQNVGRLFAALRDMGITGDTLVLFLDDNGPNTRRFVRGFRGKKTEVYEGGIRSPLLAHWPGRLPAGIGPALAGAHYDVMPTILAACGVPAPEGLRLDGRSLLPLLERGGADWPERHIVLQSHRGDRPVRYHNFMIRDRRYKLLNASGFQRELDSVDPAFELYDLERDPFELQDIAAGNPDIVARLRARYDTWFDQVTSTRPDLGTPPAIHLGAAAAPVVVLTRQDWKPVGRPGPWGGRSRGYWRVEVERAGRYRVRAVALADSRSRRAVLRLGESTWDAEVQGREHTFAGVSLPQGTGRLQVDFTDDRGSVGAHQVVVEGPL